LGAPIRHPIKNQPGKLCDHSTNSGRGTMVDFTVFIAIAATTGDHRTPPD
jgi:hypothetical protein